MKMTKPEREQYEQESPTAAMAAILADSILEEPAKSRDDLIDRIVGFLILQEFHGGLAKIGPEMRSRREPIGATQSTTK
jgi:hypothetical protein